MTTSGQVFRWARRIDGSWRLSRYEGHVVIRPASRDYPQDQIRIAPEHIPFGYDDENNEDYHFDPASWLEIAQPEQMEDESASEQQVQHPADRRSGDTREVPRVL